MKHPITQRTCKNRACRNRFTPSERHPFAIACCTGCEIILNKQHLAKAQAKPRMSSRRKAVPADELTYLKRVAALPCAECKIWDYSQAAHSNRYQDGKGRGIKANYKATFPLCCARPGEVGCHIKHDQLIGMTREEADERTVRYVADTQRQLGIFNSSTNQEKQMSYSFSVKGSTKAAAKEAAAEHFDKQVVASQPIHARDRAAVLANVNAAVDLLGDDDSKDVHVSCNGYVSWSGAGELSEVPFSSVSIAASAGYVNRESA